MKKWNELQKVCITEIKPGGWMKEFLKGQAEGMPGNLDKIGYPFDKACWQYRSLSAGGYAAWWPYEQTAYWLDAMIRTWILTGDESLFEKVRYQIEKSFDEDGDPFIGPLELKQDKGRNRWPHLVYFRAIWALFAKTGEKKYIERICRHYLNDTEFNYSKGRDCCNIEVMLNIAENLCNQALYDKALEVFERYFTQDKDDSYPFVLNYEYMMGDAVPQIHGVTLNEHGKLPAIVYTYTGEKRYLDASIQLYERIENYHMLPDGVHSSSEKTCGNESFRAHESCDISDYIWAVGYLLEATGNGKYADWIERSCFNALPGAVYPHFRGIQYFSCVNQVICTRNSTHIKNWQNTPKMAYQPHHFPECCISNIGRAMPNYVERMYQKTSDGIAVSLYGESVYDGEDMRIEQKGNYPFTDTVIFCVEVKRSGNRRIRFRIPEWTKGYELRINGQIQNTLTVNGYTMCDVKNGDKVELTFRKGFMSHASKDGGIYYTYGPFLMTLLIRENCVQDKEEARQTEQFPAYNIYPESEWRYAVHGWEQPEIINREITENPFWDKIPFEIRIPARRLKYWELVRCAQKDLHSTGEEGIDAVQKSHGATEVNDDLILTPQISTADVSSDNLLDEEMITLVPYGCTRLRLTVFPRYSRDECGISLGVKRDTQGT